MDNKIEMDTAKHLLRTGGWTCPRCTADNAASTSSCDACGRFPSVSGGNPFLIEPVEKSRRSTVDEDPGAATHADSSSRRSSISASRIVMTSAAAGESVLVDSAPPHAKSVAAAASHAVVTTTTAPPSGLSGSGGGGSAAASQFSNRVTVAAMPPAPPKPPAPPSAMSEENKRAPAQATAALLTAVERGDSDAVATILQTAAFDANVPCGRDGGTVLLVRAAERGDIATMAELLRCVSSHGHALHIDGAFGFAR